MNAQSRPDHSGREDEAKGNERRNHARRQAPAACADCKRDVPPYVYMEDGKHYCVECALLVVETERIYPAGQRAEDITLAELLRDRLRVLPRPAHDRRAGADPYGPQEEPRAS